MNLLKRNWSEIVFRVWQVFCVHHTEQSDATYWEVIEHGKVGYTDTESRTQTTRPQERKMSGDYWAIYYQICHQRQISPDVTQVFVGWVKRVWSRVVQTDTLTLQSPPTPFLHCQLSAPPAPQIPAHTHTSSDTSVTTHTPQMVWSQGSCACLAFLPRYQVVETCTNKEGT